MTAQVEIGPWLGVVTSPRPRPVPEGLPLDTLRLALVNRLLMEGHAGPAAWMAAWQEAVNGAVQYTVAAIAESAAGAARASRAPARVARRARPGADDVRVIRARLESAGIPLEAVAESRADGEVSLARLGSALEEAWLELERTAAAVLAEWRPEVQAVAAWRRPTGNLWMVTAALLLAVLLLGLMIGGHLPVPAWFEPMIDWWWRLPWP